MEKYFSKDNIYINVKGDSFEEVLKNVCNILWDKGFIKETFYNAVLNREKTFPTGLEFENHNIAIPHTDPEHTNINSIILIKPENKIIFRDMGTNSKDLDVNLILLLLINKSEEQVGVLSGIIKKFGEFSCYEKILLSSDINDIYEMIIK